MTFIVPTCECGHAEGDHASARNSFPHPPRYGVCLMPGCGCDGFKGADTGPCPRAKGCL